MTLDPGQSRQSRQPQRRRVVGLDQQAAADPDQPTKPENGGQAVVPCDAQIPSQLVEDAESVQIERLITMSQKSIHLLGERRQALITAAVTGELGVAA